MNGSGLPGAPSGAYASPMRLATAERPAVALAA